MEDWNIDYLVLLNNDLIFGTSSLFLAFIQLIQRTKMRSVPVDQFIQSYSFPTYIACRTMPPHRLTFQIAMTLLLNDISEQAHINTQHVERLMELLIFQYDTILSKHMAHIFVIIILVQLYICVYDIIYTYHIKMVYVIKIEASQPAV